MNTRKNDNKLIFTEYYLKLIYLTTNLLEFYPRKLKKSLISDTKISLYKGLQYLMYAEKEKKSIKKINYFKKSLKFIQFQEKLVDYAYYNKYVTYKNYKKHCEITDKLNNNINSLINSFSDS